MLVKLQDVLQVIVHRTPDGGYSVETNFDDSASIPWSMPVVFKLCDGDECFPVDWQDKNPTEFERVAGVAAGHVGEVLKRANHAYVCAAAARGEPTMNKREVEAELSCGSTHIANLVNAGDLPEPTYLNGKSTWLRSEVLVAKARSMDKGTARRTPLNRHERRKRAAKAG